MIASWMLIVARPTCWRPRKTGWQENSLDTAFQMWIPSSTVSWRSCAAARRPPRRMSALSLSPARRGAPGPGTRIGPGRSAGRPRAGRPDQALQVRHDPPGGYDDEEVDGFLDRI